MDATNPLDTDSQQAASEDGLKPAPSQEEIDRVPFEKGTDPDTVPEDTDIIPLRTSDAEGPRSSKTGNIDRTFLDRDEEEEREAGEEDPELEDEESWVEDEVTDEDGDPYLTIDPELKGFDDDELGLTDEDEDGDFLTAEDDDESDSGLPNVKKPGKTEDLSSPGSGSLDSDDLADEDI